MVTKSILPVISFLDCVFGVVSKVTAGTSLEVQCSGLCAFTDVGLGSVPGQEKKIPQTLWCGPKQNKKTLQQSHYHIQVISFFSCVFTQEFYSSLFTFRSVIHLISMKHVRSVFRFIFLHADVQSFQHLWLRRLTVLPFCFVKDQGSVSGLSCFIDLFVYSFNSIA